jgi:TolB-like protein
MPVDFCKTKIIVAVIFFMMTASSCLSAIAGVTPQIKTDKDVYRPGETIRVFFFNAPGDPRDWICIVAAGAPEDDAGDFKYMPRRTAEGVLTYDAPPPGKYEVRAYYNYRRNGYIVSARYNFSVGDVEAASPAPPVASAEVVKPAEKEVIRALPSGAARAKISIFYFTPLGMDASPYGITVTNTLIYAPKMQTSFAIFGKKDLEIFLGANHLQQNDQIDNMIEIGTRLGLDFVIAGSVAKKGAMIITSCKVVGIARKQAIFTHQFLATGESDLIGKTMSMSEAVIDFILSQAN